MAVPLLGVDGRACGSPGAMDDARCALIQGGIHESGTAS